MTDLDVTLQVSYLEIYNENGYDLLDPHHEVTKMEDLPKVVYPPSWRYTWCRAPQYLALCVRCH